MKGMKSKDGQCRSQAIPGDHTVLWESVTVLAARA
jgi:hypothetical protein